MAHSMQLLALGRSQDALNALLDADYISDANSLRSSKHTAPSCGSIGCGLIA